MANIQRVLDTLIRDGADVHRRNKFKNTPHDLANSTKCKCLLRKAEALPAPSMEEAETMHRSNLQVGAHANEKKEPHPHAKCRLGRATACKSTIAFVLTGRKLWLKHDGDVCIAITIDNEGRSRSKICTFLITSCFLYLSPARSHG